VSASSNNALHYCASTHFLGLTQVCGAACTLGSPDDESSANGNF
jgi:hypothetical protein